MMNLGGYFQHTLAQRLRIKRLHRHPAGFTVLNMTANSQVDPRICISPIKKQALLCLHKHENYDDSIYS